MITNNGKIISVICFILIIFNSVILCIFGGMHKNIFEFVFGSIDLLIVLFFTFSDRRYK